MFDFDLEKDAVVHLRQKVDFVREQLKGEKAKEAEALQAEQEARAAQELMQHLAQAVQQRVHQQIAKVVTTCLATVFDDPYSFQLGFEMKRGRTEAALQLERGGRALSPLHASGGGVVDITAFALRAACLMLHRPRLASVLVIDEGFKFVSLRYRQAVRHMLEEIVKDLGVQVVQVTHSSEYEIGKITEVT